MLTALLIATPILWLLWHVATAPVGYEDEQGFHEGQPLQNITDASEGRL